MRSPMLLFPAKRANRARLTSTMRLAFETTMERRRKRASQCRWRALSGSMPLRLVLARVELSDRQEHVIDGIVVRASRAACASASAAQAGARKSPCHDRRIPSPPTGLKHDPELSRSRAAGTCFQIVPPLVKFDPHRPTLRLGLLRVGCRELLQPGLHGGRGNTEQL